MKKFINKNIKAESHPAHYLMHKYWGRKPHNVVREYILNHTRPGDTVLDPFMGSGVVIIESVKFGRKAIGVDLNPIACFIAENTLANWDQLDFEREFERIYQKNFKEFLHVYETICPKCHSVVYLENSIWKNDNLIKIRGKCTKCGIFKKIADEYDVKIFKKAVKLFDDFKNAKKLYYPQDEILKYVKRNGKSNLDQLFTHRALLILGTLIQDIKKIEKEVTKNLLLMCFTSMLPNVSNMIPGDEESVNGKSGWVISKLWAPKIHTEKNIFTSFKERYKKIKKGKHEIDGKLDPKKARILNISAEKLQGINSNSVDYIFTDPPYGDSIAYFGLSMFWNAWLNRQVDYDGEIIYDPCRGKKYEDYGVRMKKVFNELHRVLKEKKYLSFTFHNRNLNIWKAVMDAVKETGFHLESVIYQEQAVSSGTQGINRRNTLKGDFVYNLMKNSNRPIQNVPIFCGDTENLIIKNVEKWIKRKKGEITSDCLYENLIPLLVEKNAYTNKIGEVVNIEGILNKNFAYGPSKKDGATTYVWQEK